MIIAYTSANGKLEPMEFDPAAADRFVWIDLLSPSELEERELEAIFRTELPTREEMSEIELSSRLYSDEQATFMTAFIPSQSEADLSEMNPVTFVLMDKHLITIRYHEPKVFKTFPALAAKAQFECDTAADVLIALLEAIVGRLADILERAGKNVDGISRSIFRDMEVTATEERDLQATIRAIGRQGDLTSNVHDSLASLDRLAGYFLLAAVHRGNVKSVRERIKSLARDIRSISDHSAFLSQKINFLLDATLGLITNEQNGIMKVVSVASVIFLPPTLLASIFGMNFRFMPELQYVWAYPIALVAMLLSALLPYLYFKWRGWL